MQGFSVENSFFNVSYNIVMGVYFTWTIRLHYITSPAGGTQAHWVRFQIKCLIIFFKTSVFLSSLCVFFLLVVLFYIINIYVYVSSWRSWLQRRCICLHGVNGLEDQGGRKGQKMTYYLASFSSPGINLSELQVNVLPGNEDEFFLSEGAWIFVIAPLTEWDLPILSKQ